MEGHDRQGRHHLRACRLGDRQFRAPDRRAWSASTFPSFRSSISISSPRRIPQIVARKAKGLPEMGVLRESDSSWYMREEAGGLLLGPYEIGAPACYVDGPSAESEYELFQEDLDRLAPYIETAIARVPAFGEVGVKKVYNGAIAYTPDGSPDRRPGAGPEEFLAQRGPFVRRHRGGRRRLAARGMDRRGRADRRHARRRSAPLRPLCRDRLSDREERGGLRQGLHGPLSRRGARRRAAAAPDALLRADEGARRGVRLGLWLGAAELVRAARLRAERGRLAKPDVLLNENHPAAGAGERPREKWSFRRSNYFEFVGAECRNVHENVGLQDMSAFAKFEVSGPGAEAWLDRSSPTASRRRPAASR